MHSVTHLAPAKRAHIPEPTREKWLAQTRVEMSKKGARSTGSLVMDRALGLGYHPLGDKSMPTEETDHPGECQICDAPITEFFVDGCVKRAGCWANMCLDCHKQHGMGLGAGRGQVYQLFGEVFHKLIGWCSTQ